MRYYDDVGEYVYAYGYEHGTSLLISADSWNTALSIAYDESETIDFDDIHEAFGFYLMQACKHGRGNSSADWYICSDIDGHGVRTSAEILHCEGDRQTIGGTFRTADDARQFVNEYVAEHELELTDSYRFQDNFTGTGIVKVSDNEWLRLADQSERQQFAQWRRVQNLSIKTTTGIYSDGHLLEGDLQDHHESLREAVQFIFKTRTNEVGGVECIEASDTNYYSGTWMTVHNKPEYLTGCNETRSLFIECTDASKRRLFRLLGL